MAGNPKLRDASARRGMCLLMHSHTWGALGQKRARFHLGFHMWWFHQEWSCSRASAHHRRRSNPASAEPSYQCMNACIAGWIWISFARFTWNKTFDWHYEKHLYYTLPSAYSSCRMSQEVCWFYNHLYSTRLWNASWIHKTEIDSWNSIRKEN